LVLWGRYEDLGRRTVLAGNRTYPDLAGVRGRVADAVLDLTNDPALVGEALTMFAQTALPAHRAAPLPDPL
jgi:hypothetical protein